MLLLNDDAGTAVYESDYIMEWLEAKYPETSLMPEGVEQRLLARKVEVLADGVCDALVLAFFEKQREVTSQAWMDRWVWEFSSSEGYGANTESWNRQMRKADGGLQALATLVEQAGEGQFLLGGRLTLADIAIGSVLGWLSLRWPVSRGGVDLSWLT